MDQKNDEERRDARKSKEGGVMQPGRGKKRRTDGCIEGGRLVVEKCKEGEDR